MLTQEKLREMYIERLRREKQCWISSVTGINKDVLNLGMVKLICIHICLKNWKPIF